MRIVKNRNSDGKEKKILGSYLYGSAVFYNKAIFASDMVLYFCFFRKRKLNICDYLRLDFVPLAS